MNATGTLERNRQRILAGVGIGLALILLAVIVVALRPEASDAEDFSTGDSAPVLRGRIRVETVGPKKDVASTIVVQAPADLEAFYRADLASLVAGTVKRMPKTINDMVTKGELLVEIDAPDRFQEVLEKEAVILQRIQESELASFKAKIAAAAVKVAEETIKQKNSQVVVAEAEKAYRQFEFQRYTGLAKKGVITPDIVDEKKKFYQVAEADVVSASVAVRKAQADLLEEQAKLEAAKADIKLKHSLIDVARKDRDRAQAMADYALIRAPFDGAIIRRNVDPGDFVQNASTSQSRPLLSLARTDIMTVVMRLPDAYAPFVTTTTDAVVQLSGRLINARVTRFAPAINRTDRTMRVEVDLFNGNKQEYERFALKGLGCFLASVGLANPIQSSLLLSVGRHVWGDNMKGAMDPFPVFSEDVDTRSGRAPNPLLPNMYGSMKLLLRNFQGAYLLPSRALFSLGGKKYLLLVKNGRARRVPVDVQMNDGRLAKVALITRKTTDSGEMDVVEELTGQEQIIISGQTEIEDGQSVRLVLVRWPKLK